MTIVAVTYSPIVGGSSVISLKDSFTHVGSDVIDADYRKMMEDIPNEEFNELYSSEEGRQRLFAHAKAKAIELLKDVDVLALSGNSAMIDPELFNKARDKDQTYDLSRTIAELALVHIATEKGMPILGVCGGHQVIAVYGGGEISDLTSEKLDKQKFMNYDAIKLNKDSIVAQIIGGKKVLEADFTTPYYESEFFGAHNQVVSKLGTGFTQTGIASDDDSIEAAESAFGVPIISTQFHPEVGAMGLPGSSFIYKRTNAEQELNLDIFRYLDKAGDAYSKKKTVMAELSQLKSKETVDEKGIAATPDIKPSNIIRVRKEQRKKEEHVGEKQEKQSSSKQDKSSLFGTMFLAIGSFFKYIGSVIRAAYNFVKETIRESVGEFLRNRVSNKLTRSKVSSLKKKQMENPISQDFGVEKDEVVIPISSFSSVTPDVKAKAPSEIFEQTPARLWKKNDNDIKAAMTIFKRTETVVDEKANLGLDTEESLGNSENENTEVKLP